MEAFNPNKYINDLLTSTKQRYFNKTDQGIVKGRISVKGKDNYIESLRKNSITIFLENMRNRSVKEISDLYVTKVDEFSKATQLYCDKKSKENDEYFSNFNTARQSNQAQDEIITKLNQENKQLKDQITNKESIIYKLQSKFEVFDKLKPVFEEFHKEYPDDDPVKVIKEVQQRKEEAHLLIQQNNELNWKLKDMENSYKLKLLSKDREINLLRDKVTEVDENGKAKLEYHIDEINNLKSELRQLKVHQKDNLKLHNYLYLIYNQLIDTFSLNKNMNLDPTLKVEEKDFKPELFDNEAIKVYIQAMITSSNNDKKNKLLREVMAYSNMMLRMFAKEKLSSKFDPVSTFKTIKDKVLEYKNHNIELKDKIRILNESLKLEERECKKANREIENTKRLYSSLEQKFEKQFLNKIKKNKDSSVKRPHSVVNGYHSIKSSNEYLGRLSSAGRFKQNINNICEFYKENDKQDQTDKSIHEDEDGDIEIKHEENDNINIVTNKTLINQSKEQNEDNEESNHKTIIDNKRVFITNKKEGFIRPTTATGTKTKSHERISSAITRPETSFKSLKTSRVQSSIKKSFIPNKKEKKTQVKFYKQDENSYIPKLVDNNLESSMKKKINQLGIIHNEFIGMSGEKASINKYEISENNDKLIRTGGNYKILPSHLSGLSNLVEHTNQLFLYKSRMNHSSKVNNLMNERNMFNKFKNYIDKTNGRIRSISKKGNFTTRFDSKVDMDEVILGKIDNILNKFKTDGVN